MLATKLVHDLRRENSWGKGSSEDRIELGVQPSDAHLREVPVRIDDLGSLNLTFEVNFFAEDPSIELCLGLITLSSQVDASYDNYQKALPWPCSCQPGWCCCPPSSPRWHPSWPRTNHRSPGTGMDRLLKKNIKDFNDNFWQPPCEVSLSLPAEELAGQLLRSPGSAALVIWWPFVNRNLDSVESMWLFGISMEGPSRLSAKAFCPGNWRRTASPRWMPGEITQ